MPTSPRDDGGSIMLLLVFLVVTIVAAVTVIADVGSLISVRQQLAATADQAAIAGAQAVDLGAYYERGAGDSDVALDPAAVAAAVNRYLAPAIAAGQQADLAVDAVDVADGTVTVRLACRAPMPFASSLGLESVPVTAAATARLVIRPAA